MNALLTKLLNRRDRMAALAEEVLVINRAKSPEQLGEAERSQYDQYIQAVNDVNADIAKVDPTFPIGARNTPRGRQAAPNPIGSGTIKEIVARDLDTGGFACAGEFLQALYRKSRGEGLDDRLASLKIGATNMSVGTGSAGGFAVPDQFVADLFTPDAVGPEVLLNTVDRVSMTSDKMTAPVFVDDNHATSAPYGITWQQVAEGGAIGDESVTLKQVELQAHKSGAIWYSSNEWLADSNPAMAQRLTEVFNRSLRWYIESLLWNGTGAGEALGALVGGGKLTIAKEVGQAADTIVYENIVKMFARTLPGSESRLIWVANRSALPQLCQLNQSVGTAGTPVFLFNATGPIPTTLLGRPLYWSEHLPAVGDAGDIVCLDPLAYVLGERQQVVIDSSPHYRFNYDQTTFRATVRLDGQPALSSTFTPANGDTCGWLVELAAR